MCHAAVSLFGQRLVKPSVSGSLKASASRHKRILADPPRPPGEPICKEDHPPDETACDCQWEEDVQIGTKTVEIIKRWPRDGTIREIKKRVVPEQLERVRKSAKEKGYYHSAWREREGKAAHIYILGHLEFPGQEDAAKYLVFQGRCSTRDEAWAYLDRLRGSAGGLQ